MYYERWGCVPLPELLHFLRRLIWNVMQVNIVNIYILLEVVSDSKRLVKSFSTQTVI